MATTEEIAKLKEDVSIWEGDIENADDDQTRAGWHALDSYGLAFVGMCPGADVTSCNKKRSL